MRPIGIISFILCYAFIAAQFIYTPVPGNTPLVVNKLATAHLTYDSFKLVFFANLTTFYKLKSNIRAAVTIVKNLTTVLHKPTYTTAAGQLEHQLKMIDADEDMLDSFRTKRFVLCDWCGKAQHWLYGVMDTEHAQKYDDKINEIGKAAVNNRELIRDQSKAFEAALNFHKNTFVRFEKKINEFAALANNQSNEMQTMQLELNESSLIQYVQLLISEYYRVFGQIRRTLISSRHGKLTELIPKKQLESELRHITKMLPSTQGLPIDPMHEDGLHIFEFAQVRSVLHRQRILMEVEIPIVEYERMHLYKAIPIPMKWNMSLVIPSVYSTYFLMNTEQSKYIPMNQRQLDAGKTLKNGDVLYHSTSTTLLTSNGICEWQVLKNMHATELQKACQFIPFLQETVIITILENEVMFINAQHNMSVYEKCGYTDFVQRNIGERGTIRLDSKCLFKTDNYVVRPHQSRMVNVSSIITPAIQTEELDLLRIPLGIYEKLNQTSKRFTELTVIRNSDDMQNLIENTKNLIRKADHDLKIDEIHYDSIESSWCSGLISTASILGIVIAGAAAVFYKFNFLNCLLTAIIKQSTAVQMDNDGSIVLDIPNQSTPKRNKKRSTANHLNEQIEMDLHTNQAYTD